MGQGKERWLAQVYESKNVLQVSRHAKTDLASRHHGTFGGGSAARRRTCLFYSCLRVLQCTLALLRSPNSYIPKRLTYHCNAHAKCVFSHAMDALCTRIIRHHGRSTCFGGTSLMLRVKPLGPYWYVHNKLTYHGALQCTRAQEVDFFRVPVEYKFSV